MVAPEVRRAKLAALAERLDRLATEFPASRDAFVTDRRAQELVAFNFLLAVQEALDLAAFVIADAGWAVPGTAREHFDILADRGIVTSDLAAGLGDCVGARNLVAHAYGRLDQARLYDELPSGVAALRRFLVVMATAS